MVGELLGKSSGEIAEAVRDIRAVADTWKVYVKEWIIVFTSTSENEIGITQCHSRLAEKYDGRVHTEDIAVEFMFSDGFPSKSYLKLKLWNCVGEFKTRALAEEWISELVDGEPRIESGQLVGRNSRDEQVLKDYGIVKLTIAASKGRTA